VLFEHGDPADALLGDALPVAASAEELDHPAASTASAR
jgi:hypothetical protein